ncbi:hypothetical protein [Flavobacterium columnare]|uniref:Uncharacterized protein n=1 Tax=Flavobacterium columnare TaxID=996 RepID=A0AAI8CIL2_9FLAO|nr:hypothetical protein [Flavobacterium columnare]AMO20627.1 hypothetical protein UN65_10030 [Flavobacterium columnare]QOG57686.1 hypothetical protein HUE29_10110 [Flavobacterium columnare]QOG60410.1 hypothetical protein HUE30_10110 [Flavobacterium columnare]QOG63130.1 hypothetical protein HUE31_10110 [Flavobacterium columnare]QOG65853.1 hypothetical protein HUE32_10120 [Flavobacterium columnare]
MKKVILILILVLTNVSCVKKETKMEYSEVNANNIVNEICKTIKHYDEEKIYTLDYTSSYSFFEVFINDYPLDNDFDDFSSSSAFEINPLIYKSGKYKVKYKMYPVGKVYNDIYNVLRDNSYLEIKLASYDLKNEKASDIIYSHYKTPMNKVQISEKYSEEKFVGAGKTYYEGSFDVDVQVPYEIHPAFEKAKDLRKMDKKELEAKLLSAYQKVWNIYQNKEYDNIARISFDSMKDELVSKYASKEDVEFYWNTLLTSYKSDTFQMQPIKDYKLDFFADGKLVALMLTTKDNNYRGNTALWAKVKDDIGTRPLFLNRYFYIPEGETEFKVY